MKRGLEMGWKRKGAVMGGEEKELELDSNTGKMSAVNFSVEAKTKTHKVKIFQLNKRPFLGQRRRGRREMRKFWLFCRNYWRESNIFW